jgi:predicted metalloendopeptidase
MIKIFIGVFGQLYVAKCFAPTAKAKIQLLVANLTSAYRTRIEKLDWMSEPTKLEAIKKLDTYTVKVGYPDHVRDYSQVVIRDDDAFGNAQRAGAANWAFYLGRPRTPRGSKRALRFWVNSIPGLSQFQACISMVNRQWAKISPILAV